MKVTAHPDGTYTLSGLTTDDVRDLAFGHCAAVTFLGTHWSDDQDYTERVKARHEQGYQFLKTITDGEDRLRLRNGRSQSRTLEQEVTL